MRFLRSTLGGVLILVFLGYVVSFLAIQKTVVRPYEKVPGRRHPIRKIYNTFYWPLRYFSANGWRMTCPTNTYWDGVLVARSPSLITLFHPADESTSQQGFHAEASVIQNLMAMPTGGSVVVTLGHHLSSEHDRFIAELVRVTPTEDGPNHAVERTAK